eukprot:746849-Hanusia_phi.AAC.5
MHIKYVRIHGFKSYREKTVCGPLSPLHNSIVGYNGSGKSNFFAALRFVLSDAYSNMRPDERAKLLNVDFTFVYLLDAETYSQEGAGANIVNAYVEIVFDNSDHRIDNEKDEVTIKRMIGLKKDEYFVDQKHVTKQDIANMLETAGFSKSNPYYIVEQGKITEMQDKERLALLKEVAGTNVYEEKKAESEKIMKESDAKMTEINKNLAMIQARLDKLDKEKEELSQYYSLDKERRSLHHALLSQKVRGFNKEIADIDKERGDLRLDSGQTDEEQHVLLANRQKIERELESLAKRLELLEKEQAALDQDSEDLLAQEYAQRDKVKHLERDASRDAVQKKANEQKIAELKREIAEAEEQIRKLEPKIAEKQAESDSAQQQFSQVDLRVNSLTAIQNATQFESKGQRDKYLSSEIAHLKEEKQRRNADEKNLKGIINSLEKDIKEAEKSVEELREQNRTRINQKESGLNRQKEINSEQFEYSKKIKELQHRQYGIQNQIEQSGGDVSRIQQQMYSFIPNPSMRALRFLDKHCKDNKIDGYYGPVINLFECNDKYNIAVEQAAGSRLFNVVVKNEEIASALVHALQQSRCGGRMQFLPLNRLRVQVPEFPQDANDAQPLLDCLRYDAKFKPAMQEIFGKTLLCKNSEVASNYRKTYNIGCVTIDGDKLSKKGAFRGGYYDHSLSKITLNKAKKDEEEKMNQLRDEEKEIEEQIKKLQQIQAIEGDQRKIAQEKSRIENDEEDIKSRGALLKKNESDIYELQTKIQGLEAQLKSPFSQALTAEQVQFISVTCNPSNTHFFYSKKNWKSASKSIHDCPDCKNLQIKNSVISKERKLSGATRELNNLDSELYNQDSRGNLAVLDVEKARLDTLSQQNKDCITSKESKEKEISEAKEEKLRKESALKELKSKLKKQENEVESSRKRLDQLADKRNRLKNELDSAKAQLRDLGSLPEAFDKYKDSNKKQLESQLARVTEELKGFKDVNKKALDQFNQFTEQREKFRERKDELEKGAVSIRELIRKLDEKKDDALQTTFRMVARNFSEVFSQIVPGGSGELVMKTEDVSQVANEGDDQAGPASRSGPSRRYTGVGVKVKFAAGGEVRVMRSLSGGQKRCDPAPFYLFDEVDANLDPMYRAAIAQMISNLKQGNGESTVQFLTSSFQPELVQAADCHWLVTHSGMSRISKGTMEDQLDIVRKNQQSAEQQDAANE